MFISILATANLFGGILTHCFSTYICTTHWHVTYTLSFNTWYYLHTSSTTFSYVCRFPFCTFCLWLLWQTQIMFSQFIFTNYVYVYFCLFPSFSFAISIYIYIYFIITYKWKQHSDIHASHRKFYSVLFYIHFSLQKTSYKINYIEYILYMMSYIYVCRHIHNPTIKYFYIYLVVLYKLTTTFFQNQLTMKTFLFQSTLYPVHSVCYHFPILSVAFSPIAAFATTITSLTYSFYQRFFAFVCVMYIAYIIVLNCKQRAIIHKLYHTLQSMLFFTSFYYYIIHVTSTLFNVYCK